MTVLALALLFWLFFLLQRAIYARFWPKQLSLLLSFSHEEAHEGGEIEFISSLSNRKALPLPWLTVRYSLPGRLTFAEDKTLPSDETRRHNDLFSIGPYQRLVRRRTLICHRRGYFRVPHPEIVTSDLFLASRMTGKYPAQTELLVFPRLIPRPRLRWMLERLGGEMETRSFVHSDPLAFRGIREYARSDDMRFINWRASAKMGGLMVNMYNATLSGTLRLLLNLEAPAVPDAEVLEESIRLCASLSEYFCAQGVSVSLLSNGCDSVTGAPAELPSGSGQSHFMSILRALARIDLELPMPAMTGLLSDFSGPGPLCLLISANDHPHIETAFYALRERGQAARWLWPSSAEAPRRLPNDPAILRWEVTRHALAPDETA